MDYKKAKNKKVKAIEIEVIDPIIIEAPKEIFISEKEQIKIDLKLVKWNYKSNLKVCKIYK